MQAENLDIEKLNIAREYYIDGNLSKTLSILDSIKGEDISFFKIEILKRNGNLDYLENSTHAFFDKIMGIFDCPYHPFLSLELYVFFIQFKYEKTLISIFSGTFFYMVGRNFI